MQDDVEELLRRNLRLTEENNRLLHSMRRAAWWGTVLRFLWYALLIGLPILLYYYFLMPYYEGLSAGYREFQKDGLEIPGFGPILDDWLGGEQTTNPETE